MSSPKQQPPLFHTGDWVSFSYGPSRVLAKVLEDRGPLGVRGRRLYRVQPPADQFEESSPFEMPEDELETASPPVRQGFEVRYVREGKINNWRAKTKLGEIRWGVKARGAVDYTAAFWEGESKDDPDSATVTVWLEIEPQSGDPGVDVHPGSKQEMLEQVRARADEMFLSRHPRAHIRCEPTTHRSDFTDGASFSFCRLGPTTHRSVPSRDVPLLL